MARWHPVSPTVWDPVVRGLTAEAKVVLFYAMTCAARRLEGIYRLPVAYVSADTGLGIADVAHALDELDLADLVRFDREVEVLLDCHALRYQPTMKMGTGKDKDGNPVPKPDLRLRGAVRGFGDLPDTPLKVEWLEYAKRYHPDLVAAIYDEYGDAAIPLDVAPTKGLRRGYEGAVSSRVGLGLVSGGACNVCGEQSDELRDGLCGDCLVDYAKQALSAEEVP